MSDLESALLSNLTSAEHQWEGSALLGDWVVIAEVYDSEGEPYIASNASKEITFWKQLGMLEARMDIVKRGAE